MLFFECAKGVWKREECNQNSYKCQFPVAIETNLTRYTLALTSICLVPQKWLLQTRRMLYRFGECSIHNRTCLNIWKKINMKPKLLNRGLRLYNCYHLDIYWCWYLRMYDRKQNNISIFVWRQIFRFFNRIEELNQLIPTCLDTDLNHDVLTLSLATYQNVDRFITRGILGATGILVNELFLLMLLC